MTTTHTTVAVPLTAAQLEVMLAEAKANEAAQAEAQAEAADKYTTYGEMIELPAAQTKKLLKAWHDAKAKADVAKAELDEAKNAILEAMQHHEVMINEETGQMLVESRVSTALVLDTARLRKEKPEIAADYQRERRSRSFRVLV